MSTTTPVTAEQLLRMPDDGCRYELVAGEVKKMAPAGWRHGSVGSETHGLLLQHVKQHALGRVFAAETGFLLARNPDTVRAPNAAFVHKDHLPADPPQETFWPGPPDLAVEVVSPGDTVKEVDEKARAWIEAGTRMVWVVNPTWRSVAVYRADAGVKTLAEGDELDGADVVPGFRCSVAELFVGV